MEDNQLKIKFPPQTVEGTFGNPTSTLYYLQLLCTKTGKPCGSDTGGYCDQCSLKTPLQITYSPDPGWQACPICNGTGQKLTVGLSNSTSVLCDVCNGKKIISILTGLPPL